jgi:hypothetical protein
VKLDRPHDIELDGDGFGTAIAFRTWVDAGSLTVRIPAAVALEEPQPEDEPEDIALPGSPIESGSDGDDDLFADAEGKTPSR